jgi:hypothetical protein
VEAAGWGTLEGRVSLIGAVPPAKDLPTGGPDRGDCPASVADLTWKVDPATKGVANVVVWLKPPKGHYLPVPPADRQTWAKEVIVRQPHCQFDPHVVVLYPQTYDPKGKRLVPTGQTLTVINDAAMPHAATVEGSTDRNTKQTQVLPALAPGGRPAEAVFRGLQPQNGPLSLSCPLHPWMRAHVWAFAHPFATVTGPDGRFRIENAPAGVGLGVQGWHESGVAVTVEGPGQEVTLPVDGSRTLNFSLKP